MKSGREVIKQFRPCGSSVEWLGERTLNEMVNDCHRGDWLLWIGKRAGIDLQKLTLAKGLIAQQVEHLMKDQRSKNAVTAAIAFGRGEISRIELDAASAAAAAAAAAAYAADAASAAAYAADAAAAADAASAAADADAYAADAASAAAYAADAASAARTNSLKKSSDICREIFGKELIELLST